MSLPSLNSFGLTRKETDIYELLLRKGEMIVGDIIGLLPYKRATVYKSISTLEKKGLVFTRDYNKKIHVKPIEPSRLLDLADKELAEQEKARDELKASLPDLVAAYILSVEKPIVSTFEGVKGLKEIYEDTLNEGKTIYALVLPVDMHPELLSYLRKSYRVRRAKLGIHAYVIAASNEYAKEYKLSDKKYERTTYLIPNDKFPFQHEINIYGNKIAIINCKKGEQPVGIVIHHPDVAKTFKAWFDLGWEAASKLYGL